MKKLPKAYTETSRIRVPFMVKDLRKLGFHGEIKRRVATDFIRKKFELGDLPRKHSGVKYQLEAKLASRGVKIPENASRSALLKLALEQLK